MATIGFDIGSLNTVLAYVGRGSVEIVRNDISERITPSLVGFTDRERLLGDPALTLWKSNFRNTCRNVKMLLGRLYDESCADEQMYSYPRIVQCDGGLAGYEVQYQSEVQAVSATSVMAGLIGGLMDLAQRSLKTPIREAVIAAPSWFSDRNVKALIDAAAIAGLPCLRVMPEHAATALDYGIYRSAQFDATEAHRVFFVNVGYASASVCIADFIQNELKVIHVESDPTLGGRNMDKRLSDFIATRISKRLGVDILQNAKSKMKIEDAAAKAKKILSANQDTVVALESVYGDEDLHENISRDVFVELCEPLRDQLLVLLNNALQKNGGAQINSIELVGGCTRVPWVQECIKEAAESALGIEVALHRTLNQDETVAKGCALQAAMLSPNFKVRDFNVVDIIVHPIAISWNPSSLPRKMKTEGAVENDEMTGDKQSTAQLIVGGGGVYPTQKWITFAPTHPVAVELCYAEPALLPPSVPAVLGKFSYALPHSPKDVEEARIKVGVKVDINRMTVINAHLSEKEVVKYTVKEKRLLPDTAPNATEQPPAANTTADESEATATPADAPPLSPEPPTPQYEEIEVEKTKVQSRHTMMNVSTEPFSGWLSKMEVEALREKEVAMRSSDKSFAERKDRLNDLESFVYNMKHRLSHGDLKEHVEDAVRATYIAELSAAAEWIYDEGENAEHSVLVSKLESLRASIHVLIPITPEPEPEACAQEGCAQEGCAQEGCAQEGCAQEGCAQEGCAQEGCAQEAQD